MFSSNKKSEQLKARKGSAKKAGKQGCLFAQDKDSKSHYNSTKNDVSTVASQKSKNG